VSRVLVISASGWTLRISGHALDLMRFHRRRRLPNETGGVLLGQFDHEKKTEYIASLLPSPPDSVEWPQVYIRGASGLRAKVEALNKVAGGGLSYVGEWHSHPSGASGESSAEDRSAARTLAGEMAVQGLPALILIQADAVEPGALVVSQVDG
jgi:integrative and conjugative element protein (TIGR02256 family)